MLLKFKNLIIFLILLFQPTLIFSAPTRRQNPNINRSQNTKKNTLPRRANPNVTQRRNTPPQRKQQNVRPNNRSTTSRNPQQRTAPTRQQNSSSRPSAPRQQTHQRNIPRRTTPTQQQRRKVNQNKKNATPLPPPLSVPRVLQPDRKEYGVYLGILNYGRTLPRDPCRIFFKFYINGEVKEYRIVNAKNKFNAYVLHNRLQEGYLYEIYFYKNIIVNLVLAEKLKNFVEGTVSRISHDKIFIDGKLYSYNLNKTSQLICEPGGARMMQKKVALGDFVNGIAEGNVLKNVFVTYPRKKYHPFVKGEPGVKTLKNYIKTALSGVGTILYVFGGGWNFAFSAGGSPQSTTIGVPKSCIDFFQHRDGRYSYQKTQIANGAFVKNPRKSYFPFHGYNAYYYAGFDCSSYLGWVLYNVINMESGKRSLNVSSTRTARTYARWRYGTFTRQVARPKSHHNSKFKPGCVISVAGHVWICLGTCKDGSILFVHSVPSWSIYGHYAGGGVQLSAIGSSKKCDAYRLADFYMKKYYPEWYKRYRPVLCKYEMYFNTKHQDAGLFQWNLTGSGLLKDPDHYANKYPHEILRDIFRGK